MEIIAYYLPQYYPFKENNDWWGEGFTEWTNVGKAKPLFRGHYQPKVPSDLGYYDLRLPNIKENQMLLAKEAGVTAFCYWHYWFGNGKVLLDIPLKQILETQSPNFPFCLGWANESWSAKVWNTNFQDKAKILIEQLYPGEADIINHFNYIKNIITDKRYLRVDNKPIFVIYKPNSLPDSSFFMRKWNDLIRKSNIADSFFFIAYAVNQDEIPILLEKRFDAVNIVRVGEYKFNKNLIRRIYWSLFRYKVFQQPLKLNYSFISKYFIHNDDNNPNIIPTLIPNWDHTPRSGKYGVVFHNSTPELFKKHAIDALRIIKNKPENRQILFLKSWNEWGEGNYMEPDLRFGKGYIKALKEAIEEMFSSNK
jgi:lipopolysaccharide biosynthesis protein